MRQGWYQAMGLEVKETFVKCPKDGDSQCEIMVKGLAFPL
jgi:hypothetical protein